MTTSPRFVSLLCVAALALAMGIGIAFTSKLVARVEPSPHDLGGATPDLSAVLERIDRLEQRLAEIERQEVAATAPGNAPRAALPDHTTADLARRIEQLERRNKPTLAERIASHHQTILDGSKTETEKVRALSGLRHLGKDAWTDAVVQEMARVGLSSGDPSIREDVWRQMEAKAVHPAMMPPLLLALANDTEASVREMAANTLARFTNDPAVVQALRNAAANDADERVRQRAEWALGLGR
jgi:hypothetical protein